MVIFKNYILWLIESLENKVQFMTEVTTGYIGCDVLDGQNLGISKSLTKFAQTESRRKPGGFEVIKANEFSSQNPSTSFVVNCLTDPTVSMNLEGSNSSCLLSGPFEDQNMSISLPHVIYNLGEFHRQKELRMVSVHAAAMVSPSGVGVIILGDKGVGKTTTCLTLGIEHGYKLIGNDLIIIQDNEAMPRVIAGSQIIDIRSVTLEKMPAVSLKLNYKKDNNSRHGREDKITTDPESLGIVVNSKPREIGLVVRVSAHPDVETLTVTGITDPVIERLRLAENMSRYIRGLATPIYVSNNSIRGYFPSMDDKELTEMRNRMIDTLINKVQFKYILGTTPSSIAEEIVKTIKKI